MVDPGPHSLGTRDRVSPVLVGRDDALQLGIRRWREAAAGRGELLLIAGESGIGKTRLLAEIVARADVHSPRAGAFPPERDTPGAVIDNLADELRRMGHDDPAARLRGRLAAEESTADVTRRRRLLLGDLALIISEFLAEAPTLLRIEDLHWADELSLDVLERVAQSLEATPSLVIATYRSDELFEGSRLRSWRARLLEQRLAEEVRLPRLDSAGISSLVEAITGTVPASELVRSLLRRSDGIPLHIEELLAAERDSAVLETVGEAVAARLVDLDPSTREIVSAASVIGRAFDVRLLEEVTAGSEDAVATALQEASAVHLVVRYPDTRIGFRHAIVCDVTYAEIPTARRSALHGAVARAASRIGFGDAYVSEHFERAGESDLAHDHALAAAADAVRVSAHREAAELYRRALRTMPGDSSPAHQAEVHTAQARELAVVDDIGPAADHLEAAIGIHRSLGDEVAAATLVPQLIAVRHLLGADFDERSAAALDSLARLDDHTEATQARAGLLAALSAATMLDRRLEQSLEYGALALELLDDTDPIVLEVRLSVGSSLVFAGRGPEGWPMLEDTIKRAKDAGLEEVAARGFRMIGSSASVLLQYESATAWIADGLDYTAKTERWSDHHYLVAHRGHVGWATGDWEGAERSARHALADGIGITTRITALIVLGYVALARAAFTEARALLEEARSLAEPMHELQRISPVLWGLAELALREEHFAEAIALCENGLTESNRVADAAYLFPYVLTGTRALLALRDTAGAREWIERCTALIGSRPIPGVDFSLTHARGLVELSEGRVAAARELLETASEGWSGLDRRWEAVQALDDLARIARRSKRSADAARLSRRARELSSGADALDAASRGIDDDDSPLSARELEVARLVAAGATNREIAERLVVSPKTVSAHVEHILAKLGVARRAEVAAWVVATYGGVTEPD